VGCGASDFVSPARTGKIGFELSSLETFVLADQGRHDAELVRVFHRRLNRALQSLGPEGSAIARHNPVAIFSENLP
jgi:hypothetical protein